MALKVVNNSYCLTCCNYPTCRNTIWLPGSVIKKATATNKSCIKCGNDFKLVQYTLRSFRHSIVLDQRLIGEDGLTYETCLMCDTSFQDLCDINRGMLSPDGTQNQSIRRVDSTTQRNNNSTSRDRAPPNRTLPNNVPNTQRNHPPPPSIRPSAPPAPNFRPPTNPPPSSHNDDTAEVKCSKCNKVARK